MSPVRRGTCLKSSWKCVQFSVFFPSYKSSANGRGGLKELKNPTASEKPTSIAALPSWQRFLEFVTCHLGVKQHTSNPRGLSQIEQSGNKVKEEGKVEKWKSGLGAVVRRTECRSIRTGKNQKNWFRPANTRVSAKHYYRYNFSLLCPQTELGRKHHLHVPMVLGVKKVRLREAE